MMQIHVNCKNVAVLLVAIFFSYLIYALWFRSNDKVVLVDGGLPGDVFVSLRTLISYCVLAVEVVYHSLRSVNLLFRKRFRQKQYR